MSSLSARRLWALCRKESFQIVRDPSSILIAFIMPVMMLFIFGYSVNLDANFIRIGLLLEDNGAAATDFAQTLRASKAFVVSRGQSRNELLQQLERGTIRGMVVVGANFSAQLLTGPSQPRAASVQILTDGAEPNTAQFLAAYVQGAWETWLQSRQTGANSLHITIQTRAWFNPSTNSRNFLVPGSIAIVMTIIGALLTSLVVAREWERGTMEALLATPVTAAELLLSKIIPYYVLGIVAMALCLVVAVYVMQVPFRGSLWALFTLTTLFLGNALGLGLFLSSTIRNQFNAAQAALTAAYLPAMMLSGFVFEIASMPKPLQWLTQIIPARYFTNALQTLFQAGNIDTLLQRDAFGLGLLCLVWMGLTIKNTRHTLD